MISCITVNSQNKNGEDAIHMKRAKNRPNKNQDEETKRLLKKRGTE